MVGFKVLKHVREHGVLENGIKFLINLKMYKERLSKLHIDVLIVLVCGQIIFI